MRYSDSYCNKTRMEVVISCVGFGCNISIYDLLNLWTFKLPICVALGIYCIMKGQVSAEH